MKQPNWKTPLILSASLLTLGTFAYWLQYSHKPKKDKSDLLLKKPIALASDDTQVALIKIKSTRGLIELECKSLSEKKCTGGNLGKWIITYPKGAQGETHTADPSTVKEFLQSITSTVATEVIDLHDETSEKRKSLLSQYGLSDEQRTKAETQFIELIAADEKGNPGKRFTAWFGVEHPIGDKTFVASAADGTINDQVVYLISNHNRDTHFSKTVTHFRDKTLFHFDRKDITEFKNGKMSGKKVNGLWTVNGYPANFDHVETVLSAISNAKAVDFVDASIIKGLKPSIQYDLKAGEQSYALALYEKNLAAEKHYYARSSQHKELVEVDPILRSNIDKSLIDFRNTILFTETEKVTATHLKAEGTNFSIAPEFNYLKGKWQAKDPAQNWDPAIASKIVDLFAMTRIKDFVNPTPTGKELYKISIGDEKNPQKFYYSIFSVKDRLYARNLNEKTNEAYLMEDSMKLALPKTENEWKIKTR